AHDTTSADPLYAAGTLTIDSVDFDIADNDTAGIDVTVASPHTVAEGGATDTYTIVLKSAPTSNVTIAPQPGGQLDWSGAPLVFTPTNWNTPQTVTLRAVDDNVDEASPHTGTLVHVVTSADLGYDGFAVTDVTADITDNDTSDLVITPTTGLGVDEGNTSTTATYTLTLTSIPSAPVTVTFGQAAPAQLTTSVPSVVLDSTNWNTGVTVDVAAVDDPDDEASPHVGTITHAMTSTDANFGGETGPDQHVDILDNDSAGILITPSAGSTDVAEDASVTDSYTVALTSRPTADVTVTVGNTDGQVVGAPTTLTFTPTNWSTAQTVNVTAVDDAVHEAPVHPGVLTHAVASADATYGALTGLPDVTVNVTDDDVVGVVVTPNGGSFELTEGGNTDDLVVTLTSQPSAPVTVDVAPSDAQTTAAPASVTIAPADWNTGETITATAVDDGIIEGLHTGVDAFTTTSADTDYDGFIVPDATAQITDNDAAGITVTPTGGSTDLDEAAVGTTDSFDVVLDAAPQAGKDVVIDLTTDGLLGVTASPATLTFTDSNWSTPQTVTVTVVDDPVDEAATHTSPIQFAVTTTDPNYTGFVMADVDASIADNDDSGFLVAPVGNLAGSEGGPTVTYDVSLTSKPSADVTINLAGDADGTVSPATLTFTDTNWATPQTATVAIVDDAIAEGAHTATITHTVTSTDTLYAAATMPDKVVDITDNDTAGVTMTLQAASPTTTDEALSTPAGTMTYDVVLDSEPTANVDVAFTVDGQLVLGAPASLQFTPLDWNTPKQVTVTAFDDAMVEGLHSGLLTAAVTSGDTGYDAFAVPATTVPVKDNDSAGVTITQPTDPIIDEDRTITGTYTVGLTSQPAADVTITLVPDPQVEIVGATTLTFTPTNYADQTVSVQAVDDSISEPTTHPGLVAHTVASTDPDYDQASATPLPPVTDAAFDINDNDVAGYLLAPVAPTLAVDEAGATSASFDLSLTTMPAGSVTLDTATLASGADVTVAPATVTFTSTDYLTPQTITVTAVDDAVIEGPETDSLSFTFAAAPASDPAYVALGVPPALPVDVADNDSASLVVDTGTSLAVAEAGTTTDTFKVHLSAKPTADVTVALDAATAGQVTVDTPTLTFTDTDWNTDQVVTVTAVDDPVVEAPTHPGAISVAVASSDADFGGLTVPDVVADVTDNDVATVTATGDATLDLDEDVPSPTPDEVVTVKLGAEPATPVIVNVSNDVQVTKDLPTVTLDSTNWSTGATINVNAADDAIVEGLHTGTLSFAVDPSSDPAFTGLTIAPVDFDITDNDVADIICPNTTSNWTAAPAHIALDEAAASSEHTASCALTLQSPSAQPIDVAVTVADPTKLVGPGTITIPAGQTGPFPVLFTAVDNAIDEPDATTTATFTITSADPLFSSLTMPTRTFDIADDDTVGVVLNSPPAPIALTEAPGATQATSFKVRLASEPTANVKVSLTGLQATAAPASLTFTPANWQDDQTVTVTAIDDPIVEAPIHPGSIGFDFTSTDAAYDALTQADLALAITDNDVANVIVTTSGTGNAVTEGGATDDFSVKLATQPLADVTVAVAGGTQVTAAPATMTFTPTDWSTPQAVTITAVQDVIVEGDHTGQVTLTMGGADVGYSGLAVPAQPVAITDDDLAGVTIVESDSSTKVAESGATDTYTIALKAQPTADVIIKMNGGTQVTTAPAQVTFAPASWSTPQTVTVTAVQDFIDEADPHTGEIKHEITTSAAGWAGANVANVAAQIADDDEAKIVVTQTDDVTKVTEGASTGDVILLSLASQPSADVSIVPTGDPQVSVKADPVVFTAAKWNDPIAVDVTAVDDKDVEGDHQGSVTFKMTTDDPTYKPLSIAGITVAVTD
ncbi:MAG: hypothetical protein JWM98_3435, partial [Thermoleophilia bacterium]|nr:hypothetical protein [Thermoleophilia bacterium]